MFYSDLQPIRTYHSELFYILLAAILLFLLTPAILSYHRNATPAGAYRSYFRKAGLLSRVSVILSVVMVSVLCLLWLDSMKHARDWYI